jgi:hypothetical protein
MREHNANVIFGHLRQLNPCALPRPFVAIFELIEDTPILRVKYRTCNRFIRNRSQQFEAVNSIWAIELDFWIV